MDDPILGYLKQHHTGQSRAVPSRRLEARFTVGGHILRRRINALRCEGHPICSGWGGYFYAENEQELEETIRQLQSRIAKIAGAKSGLVRAAACYSCTEQTMLQEVSTH